MRIGILTQYFPPEMGAPQARLYELAIRLQARGHELTILTAMPNYPTGRVFQEYRRRVLCKERIDGMRVIRTPIYPSKSTNLIVRLASYMSFVVSSLLLGTWSVGKLDLLIVESPPLFLGLAGIPLSWLTRSKMVFMVSDIWPDVAVRMGDMISAKQARILERLEGFVYRRAACVALTNPGAVEQVLSRFPEVPCSVISNGVDTAFFRPDCRSEAVRAEFGIGPEQFAVGYCGLHGIFQGLDVVVRAAELLRDEPRIRFVMVGDGPTKEALVVQARAANLDNIVFHDRQPKKRMPEILASMDVSLIPLAAALPGTMPSKVYEALAAGVPMVVTAGCEAEQLIRRYDVGRMFAAGDAAQLAAGIRELAENAQVHDAVRTNSLALAERFDRNRIAERTERLLQAVAAGAPFPEVTW
ncbi:MAG: glycosyltransferase family 4 protein [Planctomycetes bacterium]|nr:glycosyltransferase family 4 protein [Planctomycetota bacterium]